MATRAEAPAHIPPGGGLTHTPLSHPRGTMPPHRTVQGGHMRHTAIAITAAALLALTACSSSNDDDKADVARPSLTPTPAAAAGLEQAVRAYTKAYFAGEADKAYVTLSKRCQAKATPTAYATVIEHAHSAYGAQQVTTYAAQVSGDLARVSYSVGLKQFDQTDQPWAREGGAWKYDAC